MSRQHHIAERVRATASDGGMTLVEVMLALTVLSVGVLSALGTLTSAMALDEELKERGIAVRAAMSKVESIVAYDYADNIANLQNYWNQPANKDFSVEGLRAQNAFPQHGTIAFDVTDPNRIVVTVTIRWSSRKGQDRSIALPITLTEVVH